MKLKVKAKQNTPILQRIVLNISQIPSETSTEK